MTSIIESVSKWCLRLKLVPQIAGSFFTKEKASRSRRHLPVTPFRQWTGYSCTAAVMQMVADYYGHRLGHRRAIALTKCRPDGASLTHTARVLKREYGLKTKKLRTRKEIRAALTNGQPIISNDSQTYIDDHAILVVGQTPRGFYIADPVLCQVLWRHEEKFWAGADEFIAVGG